MPGNTDSRQTWTGTICSIPGWFKERTTCVCLCPAERDIVAADVLLSGGHSLHCWFGQVGDHYGDEAMMSVKRSIEPCLLQRTGRMSLMDFSPQRNRRTGQNIFTLTHGTSLGCLSPPC